MQVMKPHPMFTLRPIWASPMKLKWAARVPEPMLAFLISTKFRRGDAHEPGS